MLMRKLPVIAVLMLLAPASFAAGTVASLDYQKILQEAPQIKASDALLKQEFAPQEKPIKKEREKFEALRKRYLDTGPGTNPLQLASIQERLKHAKKKLNDMEQQYATGLALRRRQLRANFADLVKREIEAYARAHGITVVLRQGVLYANAATDITDEILSRLRADYRQAQSSSGKSAK